jgi:hypothetical protein
MSDADVVDDPDNNDRIGDRQQDREREKRQAPHEADL